MRRREIILIIILTLLLSATQAFAAYPQMELPPEKKKALRKFDPADIFPEVRGSDESRDRKKSRRSTSARNAAPLAESASQPGEGPGRGPTPRVSSNGAAGTTNRAAVVPADPGPTRTPAVTRTPPPATSLLASTALPAPTQPVAPEVQPPGSILAGSREPAVAVNRSVQATGLSLNFIFLLLSLIFFALFAVVIKLKKDLRKH